MIRAFVVSSLLPIYLSGKTIRTLTQFLEKILALSQNGDCADARNGLIRHVEMCCCSSYRHGDGANGASCFPATVCKRSEGLSVAAAKVGRIRMPWPFEKIPKLPR